MSSVAIIQHSDAIHLITDGAQYDHDGVVTNLASKVHDLPLSGCVIAFRGASWPQVPLVTMLGLAPTFDALLDMLPDAFKIVTGFRDAVKGTDGDPRDREFEVTIAGWSERAERMAAAVAVSFNPRDPADVTGLSFLDGYYPGAPCAPGGVQTYPPVDVEHVLGRPIATMEDLDSLDPLLDGFALHVAQRVAGGTYGGRAVYLVGGFAELTSVRRDNIRRQIIHEWPDIVGAKIAPEGALPVEDLQALMDTNKAWADSVEAARLAAGGPVPPTPRIALAA